MPRPTPPELWSTSTQTALPTATCTATICWRPLTAASCCATTGQRSSIRRMSKRCGRQWRCGPPAPEQEVLTRVLYVSYTQPHTQIRVEQSRATHYGARLQAMASSGGTEGHDRPTPRGCLTLVQDSPCLPEPRPRLPIWRPCVRLTYAGPAPAEGRVAPWAACQAAHCCSCDGCSYSVCWHAGMPGPPWRSSSGCLRPASRL